MRNLWAIVLAALVVEGYAVASPADLKVMSFNVRYATAKDGENAWPHRKEILLDAIRGSSPDIIGVQECLLMQAQYITRELPQYAWIGMGREADGQGEMSAILYKPNVLSPIETGNFWLSETPEVPGSKSWATACTRMATWVRFRHIEADRFFMMVNAHLDHVSAQAREESAKLIVRKAAEQWADLPTVVTGDFNDKGGDCPTWQSFIDGGFQDAWLLAAEQAGPSHTFNGWKPAEEGRDERIDWILLKGPFAVSKTETVTFNRDGRNPSDHFPVVAHMTLN